MRLVQSQRVNFCHVFCCIKLYYIFRFNANWFAVIALSVGGMIAAPISAYLVKILPINILAICVGGLIIFTNSNALLSYFVKDATISNTVRIIILASIIVLLIVQMIRNKLLSFLTRKAE